jgi:deazaflavin-dependent oxidoreductase (nitroreductase family)
LLGPRRRPGRLALAVFRVPLPLYRAGWGWLLGRTFLLLVHAGRNTGQPHAMTAMVLRYDAVTHEAVICSGWRPTTDWIRNIRARPALEVRIGRESFTPLQRFLSGRELRWAEMISHAADLCSDSAGLVHGNERRWRTFRRRLGQVLATHDGTQGQEG